MGTPTKLYALCSLLLAFLFPFLNSLQLDGGKLCRPEKHASLFIFGDSLYDPGNNNYINTTTDFQANFGPYGETFFKYPTGRFSDGRVIPDFIAEYAKLPLITPYLHPGYHRYIDGANFASGGAGALVETHQGYVIDLKTQLSYFKNLARLFRKKLGHAEAKTFFGRAVYLISIGGNDYLVPFNSNSTVLQSISKEDYVDMVIGNLTTVIKKIYKKGGRKFGFTSMLPLGCLPFTKVLKPGNTGACIDELTTLAKLHNRALPKVLQKLERELNGFKYSIADGYTAFSERINNPSKYGFTEGKIACCGSGEYRGILSCGGIRSVKEFELCENISEYVFFDSAHLSERANEQVAKLMWSGTSNVTGANYNLKALFQL
ncbi:GDSL esterase/lipase 1-like isoform X1 [Corylus avellana]|uniref:GDSL esterase/lipase 1-like isoform X1 n=1 Tax=Corylus avellana TaxID=13451 RepID=UPI00286D0A2D|nr:GDSL esterase/lipase 1-like isoform X1 [Corylus avellana]XP_059456470.1 GDSL esterase/lipase 1-like isoform X1 [Corylus avellana]